MLLNLAGAEQLTLEKFLAARERAWSVVSSRMFRLERKQTYKRSDNASWRAFNDGDIMKSINLIDESFYDPEKERREAAIERGVYTTRIRVVQFPISAYLRWEFETYFAMLRLGEEIRVIEQRDIEDIEEHGRLSDVWLFDSDFALVPKYSNDGELCGGWQVVKAATLKELFVLSDRLIDRSEPFQSFYARLKQESDTLTTW